jgi:hypothetical protein
MSENLKCNSFIILMCQFFSTTVLKFLQKNQLCVYELNKASKLYTDKKENQIFLIYEEIQNGAVAKSYMTNCLLIYGEIFLHILIYY